MDCLGNWVWLILLINTMFASVFHVLVYSMYSNLYHIPLYTCTTIYLYIHCWWTFGVFPLFIWLVLNNALMYSCMYSCICLLVNTWMNPSQSKSPLFLTFRYYSDIQLMLHECINEFLRSHSSDQMVLAGSFHLARAWVYAQFQTDITKNRSLRSREHGWSSSRVSEDLKFKWDSEKEIRYKGSNKPGYLVSHISSTQCTFRPKQREWISGEEIWVSSWGPWMPNQGTGFMQLLKIFE